MSTFKVNNLSGQAQSDRSWLSVTLRKLPRTPFGTSRQTQKRLFRNLRQYSLTQPSPHIDSHPPHERPQYGEGKEIIVVGAGPGGLLTAVLLAQRGFTVNIFEKRPPPDDDEKHHGSRSIVFGLLARGQNGFRKAGIKLPVRGQQDSIWLNGLALAKGAYRVQYKNGQLNKSFNSLPPSVLFVERAALVEHMILEIGRLEPDRVRLHYGQSLLEADFQSKTAIFEDAAGKQCKRHFDFLVGCDGRRSKVRSLLEAQDPEMYHEEHVSDRSYKGFHRLPSVDSLDLGDKTGIPLYFHLYGDSMMHNAAFWPTRYGTITGQISAPESWFQEHANTTETYEALFRDCYPDFPREWISEASRQLVDARAAPNGASIFCNKLHGASTVILGDAAHGVTPALGQGCNSALESAVILSEILDTCQDDLAKAAEKFTKARLSDVHALYHMDRNSRSMSGIGGRRNFISLSGKFHMLLGMALKKILPAWFKGPAYGNLMGDVTPYSKVLGAVKRDRFFFVALLVAAISAMMLAAKIILQATIGLPSFV